MDNPLHARIRRDIGTYDVVLYMKGTVAFPMDGFSAVVVQVLTRLGVVFKDINVLENEELGQALKTFSNWPGSPQLYIKGDFIGGADKVREMFTAGTLQDVLRTRGIAFKKLMAAPTE